MSGPQAKEINTVVRKALKCPHGWVHTIRKSGHRRMTLPSGQFVTFSSSPSDPYAANNMKRDLERLCGCKF